MELKKRGGGGGGGAHLLTLIIQQPIFGPSMSAESTPRHRSRPRSLFFRQDTISPCSEPTSPKVDWAGRVKERAVTKASTEGKGDKKNSLVRSLTSSLRGSLLVDGATRCCRSPRDLFTGESGDEEEVGNDLARWFVAAELAGKEGVEGTAAVREAEKEGEGLVLAPLNALQLMKQRSAPTRMGEGEGVGQVIGDCKRNSF